MISPIDLQKRAYLMGYQRALNFARGQMQEMALGFHQELAELSAEYERMIKAMRVEQQRYKDIDAALKAKPGDDDRLN
jgi:hypothetical protein